MLKKAGIITAASAAALVALSPLAFAGDDHGHTGPGNQDSTGVVNGLNGNNVDVPVEACNNDLQGGLVPFQDIDPNVPIDATGLLGSKQASPQTSTGDTRACGQEDSTGYGS